MSQWDSVTASSTGIVFVHAEAAVGRYQLQALVRM